MTKRAITKGWKRAAAAVAIAYALVLQALLLSFGGALHAAAAAGPQTVLCAQDAGPVPIPSSAQDHDGLCCVLSCHGSAPAGPVPALAPLDRFAPTAAAGSLGADFLPLPTSDVLPVGSRAPPRFA